MNNQEYYNVLRSAQEKLKTPKASGIVGRPISEQLEELHRLYALELRRIEARGLQARVRQQIEHRQGLSQEEFDKAFNLR